MAYDPKDYETANRRLEARRSAAFERQAHNKMIAYARFPRLREIENEMKQLGSSLMISLTERNTSKEKALEQLRQKGDALTKEREEILKQNNLPQDFLLPQYTCKKCHDTGAVGQTRCECFTALLKAAQLERINRISGMKLCSFDTFDLKYYSNTPIDNGPSNREIMEGTLAYCKHYAETFSPHASKNLLMIGDTGLGKTHLSLAIANEVIAKGFQVIYGSTQNLMASMEKEHFSGENEETTLNSLLHCELLILDDLGTEFITPFVNAYLYNIINTRMNLALPTIINTNLTYNELSALYTPRICSRIMGAYEEIPFYGKDIRILKSEEMQ